MPSIGERLQKLEVDMYYGDGKDNPPVTTRLSLVEDNLLRLDRLLDKVLKAVVGLVCAVALQVVLRMLKLL